MLKISAMKSHLESGLLKWDEQGGSTRWDRWRASIISCSKGLVFEAERKHKPVLFLEVDSV